MGWSAFRRRRVKINQKTGYERLGLISRYFSMKNIAIDNQKSFVMRFHVTEDFREAVP
jgi:hypothetical protein